MSSFQKSLRQRPDRISNSQTVKRADSGAAPIYDITPDEMDCNASLDKAEGSSLTCSGIELPLVQRDLNSFLDTSSHLGQIFNESQHRGQPAVNLRHPVILCWKIRRIRLRLNDPLRAVRWPCFSTLPKRRKSLPQPRRNWRRPQ